MVEEYCEICYENKPLSEFIKVQQCEHAFCKSCIYLYIQNIYKSKEFYNLKCPSVSCVINDLDSVIQKSLTDIEYFDFVKAKNYNILSLNINIS